MVKINDQNALLPTFSRMVSCSFLVLCMAAIDVFQSVAPSIVLLSFALFYYFFFQTYQGKERVDISFLAFLMLGIASCWFVKILYFLPLFWIFLAVRMMAFCGKTFWSSVIGIILPYWFVGGYFVYSSQTDKLFSHFRALVEFQSLDPYPQSGMNVYVSLGFVCLLGLIGSAHFLRCKSKNKIRVRMIYSVFMLMTVFTLAFILLQPELYQWLLPLLIINVSPLFAHFVVTTRTRWTNISFVLLLVFALLLTVGKLWIR